MALFQPSTKTVSGLCYEIADCVGASGDAEMRGRALTSLRAAIQHFNSYKGIRWDFLRAEAAPITVLAPFAVTGITASAGQSSAAAPAGHGIEVYDLIVASGFASGARVSATAASGFGIFGSVTGFSAGATVVSGTFTRDSYDLPSDWKATYGAKLLISKRPLYYIGRRLYDRIRGEENLTSTPIWYDLFVAGSQGKMRLLEAPNAADVLLHRYYRRMSIPTATGQSAALDIVEDYENYVVAWAKWHFLLDKGNGHAEQAKTWFAFAKEGLATMLAAQTSIPDEGLAFEPGHVAGVGWGDTSTRWIPWDFA